VAGDVSAIGRAVRISLRRVTAGPDGPPPPSREAVKDGTSAQIARLVRILASAWLRDAPFTRMKKANTGCIRSNEISARARAPEPFRAYSGAVRRPAVPL
jgi:hypothetical protein